MKDDPFISQKLLQKQSKHYRKETIKLNANKDNEEENKFTDEYFYKVLKEFSELPPLEYTYSTNKIEQKNFRKLRYKDSRILYKLIQ